MGLSVHAVRGDITKADVDAIVNAANVACLGGGGVDGAIHRAAGKRLLEACRAIPEVSRGVRCPVGEARITPGFDLVARHVIHSVGPRYSMSPDDPVQLASAFRSSLVLAEEHGLRTIAFPAISCGVYGYPIAKAAAIAAAVTRERAWNLDEIRFVLFDDTTLTAFEHALRSTP